MPQLSRPTEAVLFRHCHLEQILGYPMAISCVKLSESEYLIVGTKEVETKAIAEYKKRWQIETMFGCLKSRGFDFEQTHLTLRVRIERMMFLLALALCLAIKTGELKVKEKPIRKKNNGRYERSVFRIGPDKYTAFVREFTYRV